MQTMVCNGTAGLYAMGPIVGRNWEMAVCKVGVGTWCFVVNILGVGSGTQLYAAYGDFAKNGPLHPNFFPFRAELLT